MTAITGPIPTDLRRLTLTGEIDLANADGYLSLARAMITECKTDPCFTADLSGVTFMDSAGLGMLVGVRKAATDAGMALRLAGTSQCVRRLLEITALDGHFGVNRA